MDLALIRSVNFWLQTSISDVAALMTYFLRPTILRPGYSEYGEGVYSLQPMRSCFQGRQAALKPERSLQLHGIISHLKHFRVSGFREKGFKPNLKPFRSLSEEVYIQFQVLSSCREGRLNQKRNPFGFQQKELKPNLTPSHSYFQRVSRLIYTRFPY